MTVLSTPEDVCRCGHLKNFHAYIHDDPPGVTFEECGQKGCDCGGYLDKPVHRADVEADYERLNRNLEKFRRQNPLRPERKWAFCDDGRLRDLPVRLEVEPPSAGSLADAS